MRRNSGREQNLDCKSVEKLFSFSRKEKNNRHYIEAGHKMFAHRESSVLTRRRKTSTTMLFSSRIVGLFRYTNVCVCVWVHAFPRKACAFSQHDVLMQIVCQSTGGLAPLSLSYSCSIVSCHNVFPIISQKQSVRLFSSSFLHEIFFFYSLCENSEVKCLVVGRKEFFFFLKWRILF